MSIPIGTTVEEGVTIAPSYVTRPPTGGGGSRSSKLLDGDASNRSLEADELAGRLGPIVGAYDPESTDRLIQEF